MLRLKNSVCIVPRGEELSRSALAIRRWTPALAASSPSGGVLKRVLGVTMIGAAILTAQSARADETVMVEDNSRVACVASEKDLTRISLIGDEFASVSKVQPTNPLDDFSEIGRASCRERVCQYV